MNFPDRGVKSAPLRAFVSEKDIEEKRKQRQEEWEKTRKPEDPLGIHLFTSARLLHLIIISCLTEAPEEEFDSRTLYDRLQEQKMKKQEDYEETHKLKNMIRGLDNDEYTFLEQVDQHKIEEAERKEKEEMSALEEYKNAVSHLSSEEQEKKVSDFKKSLWSSSKTSDEKKPSSSKKSQASLLANVIKRKSVNDSNSGTKIKKPATESVQVAQCIGVLPGIGCYDSDSDASECSSNSVSEDELCGFNLLPRVIRKSDQCENK